MERVLIKDIQKYAGEEVKVQGWIKTVRCHGSVTFIVLHDRSGYLQTVYEGEIDLKLKEESVVSLKGKVVAEPRAIGGIEIQLNYDGIEIISSVTEEMLPFEVDKAASEVGLENIFDHRAFSLRNDLLHAVFKIQSEIVRAFRMFLSERDFLEITTPKIVSSGTEGGTELFEIKYFEKKAYLAQSPQFYKQMMVGAGYERVFETGKAYRAEKHDTSRHINEYSSMDYEMGFIEDHHDIMQLENKLLIFIMNHLEQSCEKEFDILGMEPAEVPGEIPIITFDRAQKVLHNIYERKNRKAASYSEISIDPEGERLLSQWAEDEHESEWLFITDYPRKKRPFYTMYYEEHPQITKSFDLLFRGLEVTTGGQRIHSYDQLVESIEEADYNSDNFSSYLDIFKYGMPPHGGLAVGLERLTMKLCNLQNIRQAALFPRDRSRLTP